MTRQAQTPKLTLWFGRHKGKSLDQLPPGYLRWLHSQCESLVPWMRAAVKTELEKRGERFVPAPAVISDIEDAVLSRLGRDDSIDMEVAAAVGDHLLDAFEEVRQLHGIGEDTELTIPPRSGDRRSEHADDVDTAPVAGMVSADG